MTRVFKPVLRETAAVSRKRPLVAELHPGFLVLYEKHCPSTRVAVDWLSIYQFGQKIQAREDARGSR